MSPGLEERPDLEERVGAHLRSASEQYSADTTIEAVRQTAKRRSLRTRAAVGACGLLALAGAASLVPTSDGPSALVTANDPTPVQLPEPEIEIETPRERPTPPPLVTAGPPPPHRIVGDGQGGFAAIAVTTSTGRTKFVRSPDGENWFDGGELQLAPGRSFGNLQHIGGSFVATVDESGNQSGTLGAAGLMSPQIAISPDLLEWQFIDFDFVDDEPNRTYTITDLSFDADELEVTIIEHRSVDYFETYGIGSRDICGGSNTAQGTFITLCSGDLIEVAAEDAYFGGVEQARRFFRSTNGETLRELTNGPVLEAGTDIFGSGTRVSEIRSRSFELLASATEDEDEDKDSIAVLLVAKSASGESVTLARHGSSIATVFQSGGDYQASYLPEEVQVEPSTSLAPLLGEGPAGWAALLTTGGSRWGTIEIDGWKVNGVLPASFVSITSADGSEQFNYASSDGLTPHFAQWSLFGDIRFYRPGTDDVLTEIPGDQARAADAVMRGDFDIPPSEAFDRELMVDGWRLSGDPIRGPLRLTSPSGLETVFSDGFAFSNGETSDGVEVEITSSTATPFAALRLQSPIQFYDNAGTPTVAFLGSEVFEALVLPVIGVPNDEGGFDRPSAGRPSFTTSWLLYSENGLEWKVIRTFGENAMTASRSSLAVGDDEILLLGPSGVTRIELDE